MPFTRTVAAREKLSLRAHVLLGARRWPLSPETRSLQPRHWRHSCVSRVSCCPESSGPSTEV